MPGRTIAIWDIRGWLTALDVDSRQVCQADLRGPLRRPNGDPSLARLAGKAEQ